MTPEAKREKKYLETLDNQYTLKFSKKELIGIFNILVSTQYKIGDAMLIYPVVKRIEPIVVSNGDPVPDASDANSIIIKN